jgi:hypothetical protein
LVTVDLSGLNIGFGAGHIPAGYTVYARAHARATIDGAGIQVFQVQATADGGKNSSAQYTVIEDAPSCLNGKR